MREARGLSQKTAAEALGLPPSPGDAVAQGEEAAEQERFRHKYLKTLCMFADVGECEEQQYRERELRNEIAHLAIEACRRGEISRRRCWN